MQRKIGIIGLGRTGLPAAEAYLKAGYSVWGYDVKAGQVESFRVRGGNVCRSPSEVAGKVTKILIMVLNDRQVEAVISALLDGGVQPGKVIVCMSTINRETLEKQASRCLEKEAAFVDCPFTGGPGRIPGGNLTLIAAAPPATMNLIADDLSVIGKITQAGELPGMGQAVKHCNQLLVGVTHAATMEVLVLARELGLDPAMVGQVVGNGIAGSDYFRLLSESVLENKPSPGGLGQMCKDVSIVMNTVSRSGLAGHAIAGASTYFKMAEEAGMSDMEGADLIRMVEKKERNDNMPGKNG